jgi:Uma2 family endonuclease
MSTAATTPMTVEQFMNLDLPDGHTWELHGGEIVDMGQPSLEHRDLQEQVRALLAQRFPGQHVRIEYPFEIGDHEIRSADVAVTEMERRRQARLALKGAPEIVVEVLSPSNTIVALKEYRRLCFASGTEIFLTLDAGDRTVEVQRRGEKNQIFSSGERFQLEAFGTTTMLAVDEVFGTAT